jgi:hypothetical protein
LRQAKSSRGTDGSGSTNDHVFDGLGGFPEIPGSHNVESMREEALFDEKDLIAACLKRNSAVAPRASTHNDIHQTKRRQPRDPGGVEVRKC